VELCGEETNPRCLWHAIDRKSGQVLAYVLADRKKKTKNPPASKLLKPFGIKNIVQMDEELMSDICQLILNREKQNQRIERKKHLQLRTRIKH